MGGEEFTELDSDEFILPNTLTKCLKPKLVLYVARPDTPPQMFARFMSVFQVPSEVVLPG